MQTLIPVAEDIVTLHAVCHRCKGDAAFRKRLDTGNRSAVDIGERTNCGNRCRAFTSTEQSGGVTGRRASLLWLLTAYLHRESVTHVSGIKLAPNPWKLEAGS